MDNETYINELVIEYNKYLYKVISNTTNMLSEADIEEIIQDTFIVLWKNINKIDDVKSIKAYLSAIAKNLLKYKCRGIKITYDLADYENIITDSMQLDSLIEQKEMDILIQNELDKMSIDDRKIFIEYYYSSKRIKEIAKLLNISESKVKVKLHRIRKKIQKILKKGGYGYNE